MRAPSEFSKMRRFNIDDAFERQIRTVTLAVHGMVTIAEQVLESVDP